VSRQLLADFVHYADSGRNVIQVVVFWVMTLCSDVVG